MWRNPAARIEPPGPASAVNFAKDRAVRSDHEVGRFHHPPCSCDHHAEIGAFVADDDQRAIRPGFGSEKNAETIVGDDEDLLETTRLIAGQTARAPEQRLDP